VCVCVCMLVRVRACCVYLVMESVTLHRLVLKRFTVLACQSS
jgi:hypothetical protein